MVYYNYMNKELNPNKECLRCHLIKPLIEFYYRAAALDKRDSHCKLCNNKRNINWAINNPDKARKIKQKYLKKNESREIYNAHSRSFVKRHKLRTIASCANGMSKKKSSGELINSKQLWSLAKKQRMRCAISGVKLTNDNMSPDHIIPFSKGGKNVIENIQLVDKTINFMKSSISQDKFLEIIKAIYLFNITLSPPQYSN